MWKSCGKEEFKRCKSFLTLSISKLYLSPRWSVIIDSPGFATPKKRSEKTRKPPNAIPANTQNPISIPVKMKMLVIMEPQSSSLAGGFVVNVSVTR